MNQKVKFFSSIRTKMVCAMAFLSVLSGVVMGFCIIPGINRNIYSTNQNYMKDLAKAYGTMFEREIEIDGIEIALSSSNLSKSLDGIGVEGITSSYVYVVAADGTMLYHPTADKIGKPVENDAVKQTVEKISKHEPVANEVIRYTFKGAEKYAGIYVNDAQDFIVVVTADSDELFKSMDKVTRNGIIGLALVLIYVFGMGSFIAYMLIRPVNMISKITVKFSDMDFSEDELHKKLCTRNDETGRMARALNQLVSELIQVIHEIKEKSDHLLEAADALNTDADETATTMEQVESAINDIAQGATSQADETQRATENIIIMGNMIQDTDNGMNKLLSFAHSMRETTEQAQDVLSELKKVNAKAEEYINVIAEQTNTTNESALKISEATKLITAIAEETNLLSLNASIEAARAGTWFWCCCGRNTETCRTVKRICKAYRRNYTGIIN